MSSEINKLNVEYQKKSSWQAVREASRAWWEQRRVEGRTTGFGHPDELAEHVVFGIRNFFNNSSSGNEVMEMDKAIARADYSEVVDRGEERYGREFLPNNPEAKSSIVLHVLDKIKGRMQA